MKKQKKKITAAELDRKFDEGKEDIIQYFDMKTARVVHPVQRINIDIPHEILEKVDREAARIGVPRTSLIKLWISERLDRMAD